jgi:soluble lytic murein transglycosylase
MVVARGLRGLAAGFLAVSMVVAAPLPTVLSRANDKPGAVVATASVDPVTTGSIDSAAAAVELPSGASAQFRSALELLASGDQAGAYELARSIADATERRTIQWAAIYYGNGEVPSASVQSFTADAPAFAATSVFKTRLEQALIKQQADGTTIIKLLGGAMPNTLSAQIALAQAYVADGQKDRAARIARSIWTESFLDKSTEALVLDKLGDLLDRDAHWARAMHMMMHDRATGVERLLKYLSPAQKSLAVARNAVSRDAKDARKLLDNVDPSMQSNPVYLFSRAQLAR